VTSICRSSRSRHADHLHRPRQHGGPEYRIGEAYLGGFNGIPSLPTIAFPSVFGLGGELSIRQLLAFAIGLAAYFVLDRLVRGRFDLMMDGLRCNELRMELLGYNVR
jgi:ABC-type branched-subunit amino acid transport system permease subunit